MQFILQIIVACALIGLAALFIWRGQSVPEWIVAAIVAAVGAVFGASAVNGFNNIRKSKR